MTMHISVRGFHHRQGYLPPSRLTTVKAPRVTIVSVRPAARDMGQNPPWRRDSWKLG